VRVGDAGRVSACLARHLLSMPRATPMSPGSSSINGSARSPATSFLEP
jgi:hypothetical protein